MTERCEHCRGTGQITVQSRCYEYPTFATVCYGCAGTGIHPEAFSLDMRGERLRNDCLMESERWSRAYADTFMGTDPSERPSETEWVAEQIAAKEMEDAA